MSSKYDVAGIISFLQEQPDINPDTYDGSYELLRETVRSYASLRDYAAIDYLDLNALYLMVIGTWKHGIERKKETINSSHLPEAEKVMGISPLFKYLCGLQSNVSANEPARFRAVGDTLKPLL